MFVELIALRIEHSHTLGRILQIFRFKQWAKNSDLWYSSTLLLEFFDLNSEQKKSGIEQKISKKIAV